MSLYELIPDEAYDNAPDEDADQFVYLARIAQTNLQRMLDDSQSRDFESELRSHFMATVSSQAEALGIGELPVVQPPTSEGEYTRYQIVLSGLLAKARLRGRIIGKPHSVQLGKITREKIRQEIEQLKVYVAEADLTDAKRSALTDKLDDLLTELQHTRMSFARTMAIAASIMGVVGGSAGAIAAAPKIPAGVSYIISLIGLDKEREDAEIARLAAPIKAITSYVEPARAGGFSDDLDDDVPF